MKSMIKNLALGAGAVFLADAASNSDTFNGSITDPTYRKVAKAAIGGVIVLVGAKLLHGGGGGAGKKEG